MIDEVGDVDDSKKGCFPKTKIKKISPIEKISALNGSKELDICKSCDENGVWSWVGGGESGDGQERASLMLYGPWRLQLGDVMIEADERVLIEGKWQLSSVLWLGKPGAEKPESCWTTTLFLIEYSSGCCLNAIK